MSRSAFPNPAREVGDRTWWAAVALLLAAAFGTNVSTPLALLYRDQLHVGPTVLTAVFGVYALGLAPSLLFGGPASDRFGRTRLLLPATVLAALASLIFLLGAHSTPMLFLARFVQGLATGAVFSVGSAWLQELLGGSRAAVAARRGSLALNVGFCLGPLTAGLLGQYGPWPLALPYLVHAALVVVLLAAALRIARHGAWSSGRTGTAGASLLPRAQLLPAARRIFRRRLIPTAICVYAFPSVGVIVLPLALGSLEHAVAFAGVAGAVTLGAGALVQPFAHVLGERTAPAGVALGAAGYGLGAVAVHSTSLGLVLISGFLLGAGGGLCLNAGLVLVQRLSTARTRGACNGLFYTWAYLGFAAPFLATAFVGIDELVVPMLLLTGLALATAVWLSVDTRAAAIAARVDSQRLAKRA